MRDAVPRLRFFVTYGVAQLALQVLPVEVGMVSEHVGVPPLGAEFSLKPTFSAMH